MPVNSKVGVVFPPAPERSSVGRQRTGRYNQEGGPKTSFLGPRPDQRGSLLGTQVGCITFLDFGILRSSLLTYMNLPPGTSTARSARNDLHGDRIVVLFEYDDITVKKPQRPTSKFPTREIATAPPR